MMQENLFTEEKRFRDLEVGLWLSRGEGGEEECTGSCDWYSHTAICKTDNQQGPTV